MTAAADELVVTQPSVSSALAALGRELDCELFERAGRGIRLTAAGAAYVPYAADVLGLLQRGRVAAREASAVAARRLEIAAVTTAAESFVPGMMRSFAAEHPDVELTLVVGNRQEVLERVSSHSADVAITGKPPGDDRLLAEPFMENAIVCITAPDDPAAGERPRRPGPAVGSVLAPARARVGNARAGRAVPRRSQPCAEDADPRLKRRDQAGRACGPRDFAALESGGGDRARVRVAGRAPSRRRTAAAAVVPAPVRDRPGPARGGAVHGVRDVARSSVSVRRSARACSAPNAIAARAVTS